MVTLSKKSEQIFREVFKNNFGYYPKSKTKLLKDSDVNDENLSKLQLMGYIPYVVEVMEKFKNPTFRDVVKYKGTAAPTSCGTLGSLYRQIGFIKYDGRTMVKGDNFDKFLTTKWDWFVFKGSIVLVKGEKYPIRRLQQFDWSNRWEGNYVSLVPKSIDKKLYDIEYDWKRTKSNDFKKLEQLRKKYETLENTEVTYK